MSLQKQLNVKMEDSIVNHNYLVGKFIGKPHVLVPKHIFECSPNHLVTGVADRQVTVATNTLKTINTSLYLCELCINIIGMYYPLRYLMALHMICIVCISLVVLNQSR